MRRSTIYNTVHERLQAPCPNCGVPNGTHIPEQARTCWRAELRHPDADADDILLLLAGGLHGVGQQPDANSAGIAFANLVAEIDGALEERLAHIESFEPGEVEAEIIEEDDEDEVRPHFP